jgi:hypothetical protein
MNERQERRARWKKWIEEQAASGLSRREFCDQNDLVLSQFTYHYLEFQKKKRKALAVTEPTVLPIQLRPASAPALNEIKVWLPNGLQLSLPCTDNNHFKHWLGVLKSC